MKTTLAVLTTRHSKRFECLWFWNFASRGGQVILHNRQSRYFNKNAINLTPFFKNSRINIRLSSRDLRSLQAKALMEGMSYQTLVSSILHKFIDGQLVDKSANKANSADAKKQRN